MMQRILNWLEYDEVTLFCLNYAFIITVVFEFFLNRDQGALLVLAINPLVLIYGISIVVGGYYSLKHIWIRGSKTTREVFLMIGGGAWLAVGTAAFSLIELAELDAPWFARLPAYYAILYNFLILWFMGAVSGFEIAHEFMSERDAQVLEAIICTLLVSILAVVLLVYLEWTWWQSVNACVFYSLSINKLLLRLLHLWNNRRKQRPA